MNHLTELDAVMFLVSTATRAKGEKLNIEKDEQMTLAQFIAQFPSWTNWAKVAATATKLNKKGVAVPWLGTKPLSFPNGVLSGGERVHITVKRIA